MGEFISEDDLNTFEGWLRYQGFDSAMLQPDELQEWRRSFDEVRKETVTLQPVGLMKPRTIPGEHRYAVAVREGSGLWLVLWVRRSPKGEFFVMVPRADRGWDVHTSYHLDGRLHVKSRGSKVFPDRLLQPLTGTFRDNVHLGSYSGFGPKRIGTLCDPPISPV
jgi:hypothetical protein